MGNYLGLLRCYLPWSSNAEAASSLLSPSSTESGTRSRDHSVFDPFSNSEMKPRECHMLTVKVIRGRNITLGRINDFFDTPDPYVKLKVPEAGSLHRSTKVIDNNKNPEWNETFRFILNPCIKNSLNLEVWDSDYNGDDFVGSEVYDLEQVPLGVTTNVTVTVVEETRTTIDLELTKTLREHSDIQFGRTLCEEERKFVQDRKQKVLKVMQEVFGDEGPQNLDEVPVIGVMGSGGGFRAMTAFCGVVSALSECGVLDMTTYLAALSGSSWYIGHLYSQSEFPDKTPKQLQEVLKSSIAKHWTKKLFTYSFLKKIIQLFREKKAHFQPVTITDFFGVFIGEVLLGEEMEGHLSDQTKKIDEGDLPLPLYTAVRVKQNISAEEFSEWLEFSPYAISMPKYGISIKPQMFNSKFHLGRVEETYPEPKLHFLLGIFGSAFAILMKRLMKEGTETSKTLEEENETSEMMAEGSDESDDEDKENVKSIHLAAHEHEASQSAQTEAGKQSSGIATTDNTMILKSLELLMGSDPLESRKGRAAKVLNFCSGIDTPETDAFSPFSCTNEVDENKFIDKRMPAKRSLYVVDAGLSYLNLPSPALLRPQRHVELIVSFDFTANDDGVCPLDQIRRSEIWARKHGVPFPPISISEETIRKEGVKECYVFKHPEDNLCPIVVHFPLINDTFKTFKIPGEPRVTPEEKDFANFSVFENKAYDTMNFQYTDECFDRLAKLMSYNTLNNKDKIFDAIKECTNRRRQKAPRPQLY